MFHASEAVSQVSEPSETPSEARHKKSEGRFSSENTKESIACGHPDE